MSRRAFFERFAKQEKNISRSLSLPQGDWDLMEAYRLYGEKRVGYEIPLSNLVHEIVVTQIKADRGFMHEADALLSEVRQINEAAKS